MVKTMVAAHRAAAETRSSPGPFDIGPMFERCTEDEHKGQTIPEWHRSAEYAGEQRCDLGHELSWPVFVQLRMDEGGDGELVACHHSDNGCGRYVVGNGHTVIGCSAVIRAAS